MKCMYPVENASLQENLFLTDNLCVQREGTSSNPPGYEIPDGWLNCPPFGHNLRPNNLGVGMIPCKVSTADNFLPDPACAAFPEWNAMHPPFPTMCRSRLVQNSADTSSQSSNSRLHSWSDS